MKKAIEHRSDYSNISSFLIEAAEYFAGELEKCEYVYSWDATADSQRLDEFKENDRKYKSCAAGAIIFADAYVESAINTAIAAVIKAPEKSGISRVDAQSVKNDSKRRHTDEEPSLRSSNAQIKCQRLLALLKRPMFSESDELYKHTEYLRKLRNTIAHSSPEYISWVGNAKADRNNQNRNNLRKFLRTSNIGTNAWYKDLFPTEYLSRGCAEWACVTAKSFIKEFIDRSCINIPKHDWEVRLSITAEVEL